MSFGLSNKNKHDVHVSVGCGVNHSHITQSSCTEEMPVSVGPKHLLMTNTGLAAISKPTLELSCFEEGTNAFKSTIIITYFMFGCYMMSGLS